MEQVGVALKVDWLVDQLYSDLTGVQQLTSGLQHP